jgi:hypothetical protein
LTKFIACGYTWVKTLYEEQEAGFLKTLKGFDAIDAADRNNVLLFDLEAKKEITAERAMVQIHQRRDPGSFVIQNWPDNEEEAEAIVFKEFQKILRENHWAEASLLAINTAMNGELSIHLRAAELAAGRLVKQGKLELAETARDYNMYRIPRSVRFSDAFLKELREIVCEECANLDVEGSFHEACLMNLFDYLQERNFTVRDIIQLEVSHQTEIRHTLRPSIGMQWLSKTASATKSRLKSVVQPILNQESENIRGKIDESKTSEFAMQDEISYQNDEPSGLAGMRRNSGSVPLNNWTGTGSKGRISKQELIAYLQSVEVVENPNEIDALKSENVELVRRVRELKQDYENAEKQRAYYEKQCHEMQHDLDVLVQAMQIAKRRDPKPDNIVDVVDATYQE